MSHVPITPARRPLAVLTALLAFALVLLVSSPALAAGTPAKGAAAGVKAKTSR